MAEAFGGYYKCPKGHEHELWFFDSKPKERPCPKYECKEKAVLIRVLDPGGWKIGKRKPKE